jgi:Pentapeptide repeats (8 copies)
MLSVRLEVRVTQYGATMSDRERGQARGWRSLVYYRTPIARACRTGECMMILPQPRPVGSFHALCIKLVTVMLSETAWQTATNDAAADAVAVVAAVGRMQGRKLPLQAGIDLTGIDLTGIDLTGIDLTGIDLARANLTGANLVEVDLTDANLTNAKLNDADLGNAKLSNAKLSGAQWSGRTVWPRKRAAEIRQRSRQIAPDMFQVRPETGCFDMAPALPG